MPQPLPVPTLRGSVVGLHTESRSTLSDFVNSTELEKSLSASSLDVLGCLGGSLPVRVISTVVEKSLKKATSASTSADRCPPLRLRA